MPTLLPINGVTVLRAGTTTTMADATAGGTWSSSNTAIATVVAATGVVTGVSGGSVNIIYTVGSDSIALTLTVLSVSVSNGFDLFRVFPAFQERLGWHQPTFTNAPVLNGANLTSTSGRWYDRGFHKAVNIRNYYETQEDTPITDVAFNQLLQDEDQAVIMRCLNGVFNKPQLIEHKINYTRTANVLNVTIPNQDNFCGYRINVAPGDYAVVLDTIALYFNKSITFNIYLFNDLKIDPVYTKSVTTVENNQTIVSLGWLMNYMNTATDGDNMGGVWYLGYFQKDIADSDALALDEQLNLWSATKIFGAYPFQAPRSGDLNFTRNNPSVNFRSYGMNIEVSSYRDYTQKIVQNPQLFDEARGLMMAINVLEQEKYSTRSNAQQRNTADFARNIDLDINAASGQNDQYPFVSGLKQQLKREIERINTNFWKKPEAASVPIGNSSWYGETEYLGMDIRDLPSRETLR